MDQAAQRRVEDVADRIVRNIASSTFPILRASAATYRAAPRAHARRLLEESGRSRLFEDASELVRARLDGQYGTFDIGILYGRSRTTTTAAERVEIAIALDDLLLATTVEDLLARDDVETLTRDGESLLIGLPPDRFMPSVWYAPQTTRRGSTQTSVRAMQMTLVVVLFLGSVVMAALFGLIPGLIGFGLVASMVASWIYNRRGDPASDEGERP